MCINDREATRQNLAILFNWRNSPRIQHGASPRHHIMSPKSMEITLVTGRLVTLSGLYQFNIYGGVLCGLPPDPEHELLQAIDLAEAQFPNHKMLPIVLEPRFHTGQFTNGMELVPWIKLPSICSIAEFSSAEPARNSHEIGSSVLVIWFQDHYGQPEDDRTLEQLTTLDWETHAQHWAP